jgi:carbamoyltransferase
MVTKPAHSVILGLSAYYHDSAAALVVDGVIVAAAHEERFSRKKHDARFPKHAAAYCLNAAGLTLSDVDAVVFYDKPFLKFERILETVLLYAPRGFAQFLSSMTVWVKEKIFLDRAITKELKSLGGYDPARTTLLFSEHHLSHAASAFFPSPFSDAAVVTMDGVGEWATASIMHGVDNRLTSLKELRFPHSIGLWYSACTYFLGFKVNSGEYKLMGLAPYGRHGTPAVQRYKALILNTLVTIADDGSVHLHQRYFNYASGLTMINEPLWEALFGMARRRESDELTEAHCDLALAIQEVTEDMMVKMARHAQKLTGSKNLCLAGGVALNCVGNSAIVRAKIFDAVWVQPAAGDAGGALGAALAVHHHYYGAPRTISKTDAMQGAFLGPQSSDAEIEVALKAEGAVLTKCPSLDAAAEYAAGRIADGAVVGWFQGRMEWGPRSLGARSILADPRNPEMQKKLNLSIKFREGFRPFAPAVRVEDVSAYFDWTGPSPYMLFTAPVKASLRRTTSVSESATWKDRLYSERSSIPAVTHLDYSARLQTVHQNTNPLFHHLISAFEQKTGCGVVVNTSFNVRGEPIVCTPLDAYRCFMATHMDVLVIGSYIAEKMSQPKRDTLTLADTHGTD